MVLVARLIRSHPPLSIFMKQLSPSPEAVAAILGVTPDKAHEQLVWRFSHRRTWTRQGLPSEAAGVRVGPQGGR